MNTVDLSAVTGVGHYGGVIEVCLRDEVSFCAVWSAPLRMDRRDAVQLATCRACSSSNLTGLLYPSAEWRRLAL